MRYCRHCRREKSNLIWTPLSLTGLIRANRSGSGLQNWSGSTHCSSGSSLNKSSDKDSWTIFSHDFTAYKRTHIILHVMPSDASWLVLRSLWTYYASVTPFPGCLNFFFFFFCPDELTVPRYRTEKPSKSPPPPPPRRSFPSSPGMTSRSGEPLIPGKSIKVSPS